MQIKEIILTIHLLNPLPKRTIRMVRSEDVEIVEAISTSTLNHITSHIVKTI